MTLKQPSRQFFHSTDRLFSETSKTNSSKFGDNRDQSLVFLQLQMSDKFLCFETRADRLKGNWGQKPRPNFRLLPSVKLGERQVNVRVTFLCKIQHPALIYFWWRSIWQPQRLAVWKKGQWRSIKPLIIIIIIIKAICNVQDPLKKAANTLSGSEKMLVSIYNVSYKQQSLQLCPKGRETTVQKTLKQPSRQFFHLIIIRWPNSSNCIKQSGRSLFLI